jgi:hypothetical protein
VRYHFDRGQPRKVRVVKDHQARTWDNARQNYNSVAVRFFLERGQTLLFNRTQ